MSDLVSGNYRVLLVMSRFGIGLGFGDKTIGEVCKAHGVDTGTFLTVVNMVSDTDAPVFTENVSAESLLAYLHNSHDYFLGFRLPAIRAKLAHTVGEKGNLARAIMGYFDEYVAEVDKHMSYEERVVFPYVRRLLEGKASPDYSISVFERQHDQVEARLSEFKNIIIKYYPSQSTNEINGILFDIFSCERDLASHNAVEDRIFVPLIAEMEQKIAKA